MSASVHTSDPRAFREAMSGLDPTTATWAAKVTGLIDVVRDRAKMAGDTGRPTEKVAHLELAKWGLTQLRECGSGVSGFVLTGVDDLADYLDRLEQTYRAFGFYRLAGVE